MRKYRLDEIPQLISVIKGKMNLIGPRPERPELEEKLKKEIPNYNLKYLMKPDLVAGRKSILMEHQFMIQDETKL